MNDSRKYPEMPNKDGIELLLRTHFRPAPGYEKGAWEPYRVLLDAIHRTVYLVGVSDGIGIERTQS
jgi:hypothetical protein